MNLASAGYLIIGICLVVVGIFLGGLVPPERFTFSTEIDPLSGLSIMISAVLVIYVSILFEGVKEKSKRKKEIVLEKTSFFIGQLEGLRREINANNLDLEYVPFSLKSLYQEFYAAKSLINIAGYLDQRFESDFTQGYRKLRALTTLTSKDKTNVSPDIEIVQGRFIYSQRRIRAINDQFSMLRDCATKEQMRLIDL